MTPLRDLWPYPDDLPTIGGPCNSMSRDSVRTMLNEAIYQREPKVIVEIGCWEGGGTCDLARRATSATIYAIDTWVGGHWSAMQDKISPERIHGLFALWQKNTYPWRERIIPLRMDSISGLYLLHEHEINPGLIYIDAGHEYEAVHADLQLTLKFFPEAIVICDDYDHAGVQRAVDEIPLALRPGFRVDRGACVLRWPS